jgi:hypothetical protein
MGEPRMGLDKKGFDPCPQARQSVRFFGTLKAISFPVAPAGFNSGRFSKI